VLRSHFGALGAGASRHHHYFFFSSRRRHKRSKRDWSSDVCSSDLARGGCCAMPSARRESPCMRSSLPPPRMESPCLQTDRWIFRSEERRVGKECGEREFVTLYDSRV